MRIMNIRIITLTAAFVFFGYAATSHAAFINTGANCDLLNAIAAAEADAISMGCSAGSGADIIILNQDELVTTEYGNSGNAFQIVTTPITIRGNGHLIEHDNQSPNPTRLFQVSGTNFNLENIRFLEIGTSVAPDEGGVLKSVDSNVTLSNVDIEGFRSESKGGALFVEDGTLSIKRSHLFYNLSYVGGSVFLKDATASIGASQFDNSNAWFEGGAIATDGESSLDIFDTTFWQNFSQDGSAINAGLGSNAKSLRIRNSEFRENHSFSIGGAVTWRGFDGTVDIRNTTFLNNIGDQDSAAFENNDGSAKVTILNSTFSGNTTPGTAAAISNRGEEVEFDVAYNTFINNTSLIPGGAFASISPLPWIDSSVENNIFTGNTGGDCDFVSTVGINIVNNLSNNTICGGLVATGVHAIAANNGGFGKTHKLLLGSNAIDAAVTDPMLVSNPCPSTDQRAVLRPFDGNGDNISKCDIGAFESNKKVIVQHQDASFAKSSVTKTPTLKEAVK